MRRIVLVASLTMFGASACAQDSNRSAATGTPTPAASSTPAATPTPTPAPTPIELSTVPGSPRFPLGVSAGEARADSLVFWTRYTGSNALELVIDPPAGEGEQQRIATSVLPPPSDAEGIVKLRVEGLAAGARWRYAFVERDAEGKVVGRSRIGEAETAWAPGTLAKLRFVATGDASRAQQPFTIMQRVAEEDARFFVFDGDTVYADSATNLVEYRTKYRNNWSDAGLQASMATHGFYTTWDDHEVYNNYHPETADPDRLLAAYTAFYEYNTAVPSATGRHWRSFRWGDTAEVFVVDSRSERSSLPRLYVSLEQMQWLKEGLASSTATFKFVVNSVPIATFAGIAADDRWEGYPDQRQELLDHIWANEVRNVYFLSADFHAAIVARLDEAPGTRDFVMGPIAVSLVPVWDLVQALPHIEWANGSHYNYFVFEADPTVDPPLLRVQVKNPQGNLLYEGTFDGTD